MSPERLAVVLESLSKRLREPNAKKKIAKMLSHACDRYRYDWFARSAGELLKSWDDPEKDLKGMNVDEAAHHGFEAGQDPIRRKE